MLGSAGNAAAQAFEILRGIVQTVGMIYTQAIYFSFGNQVQDQAVGGIENRFILHAEGGQVVGIEEAPVVDVIGSHAPIGQAEGLRFDEFVEFVETRGASGIAVDQLDCAYNSGNNLRGTRAQLSQPALVN